MITEHNTQFVSALKNLSPQDWADYGVNDVAYMKPVVQEGAACYAIHAANGTPLAVMESRAIACAAILQNELEPVSVH